MWKKYLTNGEGSRRRLAVPIAAGLLLILGLSYGGYLWHYSQTHVSTDDAYVAGHLAPVSARISGTVKDIRVTDNQDVKAGDVLLLLDPRDYEVALAQARAAVEAAKGDLENSVVNVPLTDESTRSLVQQAEASVAVSREASQVAAHDLEDRQGALKAKRAAEAAAKASVQMAEADLEKARLDRDRMKDLVDSRMVAQQDFDHADAAFRSAQAALESARQRASQAGEEVGQAEAAVRSQTATVAQSRRHIQEATAALANATSQRQQVKVRETQVESARGRLAQATANLQQAELNLEYTTITAPVGGRVSKKTVEVGQVVQPGQTLLSIVDLDDIWIVANFKETELTHVRAGQRVTVRIDTYPGVDFKARVDSIQAGSGAVFSLLPPENATGNFVKVVQRIPVKLIIERGENARHLLVPGMSVVPTIDLN
ncbi:MAG TPA: HlyD family secretion protein [Candidatus Baltobacteraceae bacterium]|nr:HlyD family secretion protein [Candidatus Baltobacteraceae bacterium]